jgi:hypothetical protein
MSAETRNATGKNSEQRPADAYASSCTMRTRAYSISRFLTSSYKGRWACASRRSSSAGGLDVAPLVRRLRLACFPFLISLPAFDLQES